MPFSNFTPLTEIAENSAATPGLWNAQYSILSRNFSQLITDASNASNLSSGNVAYAQLPTGSGTWQTGSGTTITVARSLLVSENMRFSTPSAGSIVVGDGNRWVAGRIFPGTNVTVTQSASGITINAEGGAGFLTVANASGTSQFGAASNDTLRFGSGSELSITFDTSNKSLTYSMQPATAAGHLWIGAAAGSWSRATLSQGTGITVTNAANAITVTKRFHGVKCQMSSLQTVNDATDTALQFGGADVLDTNGYHDPATNNTRITIPAGLGGPYMVSAGFACAANGTGVRNIYIDMDGAASIGAQTPAIQVATAGAGGPTRLTLAGIMQLSASSYIEFVVWQNSGGGLGYGTAATHFSAEYLGPTP